MIQSAPGGRGVESSEQLVVVIVIAFAGLAAVLAVGAGLYDDEESGDGRPAPRDGALRAEEAAAGGVRAVPSDAKNTPVHLSVSAGDAEFEPASVQGGKLETRFTVKNDDVELRGSFRVDIVDGNDMQLKQRVLRYRPLLLAILERALRSGPPVRTSPPVVSSVKPVAGATDIRGLEGDDGFLGAFAGNTLVVCGMRAGKTALFAWSDLDAAPKTLHELGESRVVAMAPSPDGARIALVVVTAGRKQGGPAVDPSARLLVVDTVSGVSKSVLETSGTFRFHVSPHLAWSASADRLAIDGVTRAGRSVKIVDPATGAAVGETPASLGASLVGWERDDRDAVLVRMGDAWHRWRPGADAERVHLPFMLSPDTRFMLVVREVPVEAGGERVPDLDIVRRDDKPWSPMEGEEPDDLARDMLLKDVLEHRVRFVGGHGAVILSPEPMVLDLDSLAARYLLPPMAGVALVGASPAGRVVVRDADGKLHWGTAAAWA